MHYEATTAEMFSTTITHPLYSFSRIQSVLQPY